MVNHEEILAVVENKYDNEKLDVSYTSVTRANYSLASILS